jgi:radical SAM superfamily enzyme YgiQ (UPF0313 family)
MKVVLINPPHFFDGKSRLPSFFPLGLGYIARYTVKDGHDVEVFDIWANRWDKETVIEKVKDLKADIFGIGALSTQYGYVKWLIDIVKRYHSQPIVIGGALATFSPEVLLKNTNADICVIGEGEITFPDLLKRIGNLNKVKGIAYKIDEEIKITPPRPYIKNLDTLEFPLREIFDMDIYLRYGYLDGFPNIKAHNVITSRGCPYNCDFCSKVFLKRRERSPESVAEEIEFLKESYNVKAIFFNDELLVSNKKRMYQLLEKIRPLRISWQGQARVNTVDLELLKAMKEAGCVSIGLGIESGSQAILNRMNKKTTVSQNLDAIKAVKDAGLDPIIQCIFGYEGENDSTLSDTIDFFKRANIMHEGFFTLTPLPGTELYKRCLEKGIIKDEDKYLSNLASGYNPDRELLVNLTDFKDAEEFYEKKKWLERKIGLNYLKNHPLK